MQVFELVKSVLDENYEKIVGTPEKRDELIRKRLTELQDGYAELAKQNDVSYGQPSIRFAYIYKYVASHSNLVYQKIQSFRLLREAFQKPTVSVSCIGGGPGSDLVGILKFLADGLYEDEQTPKLRCHILDGENAWADAWSDVDEKIDADKISTYFSPMDVTDENSWTQHSKYLNADLFTMIYFASEIFALRESANPFFKNLFGKMKSGALLLYIDNNASCFTDWFDSLAKAAGLEVVKSGAEVHQMTTDEEKTLLGDYLDKFGPVKLRADIAFRIYRKSAE